MSTLTITRGSFLALVAGGMLAPRKAFGDIRDDLELLRYALTLEYVESALYRDALKRTPGLVGETRRMVELLRDNEIEHVDALRQTIADAGGRSQSRPRVDFGGALDTRGGFLKLANTLEDTGVSAYNGAAPAFENEDFVAAFASVAQIEARHAAVIRMLRGKPPAPLPLDKASNQTVVRQALGPYTVD